jgi:hypothetical protein
MQHADYLSLANHVLIRSSPKTGEEMPHPQSPN